MANGGTTLGFFNPSMYTGALSSSYSHYMHDITSGSNASTAGTTVYTYNAVTGYDDVTGWGSPNGEGLLYYLNARSGYVFYSYDLTPYIGKTVFTGVENASLLTFFKLDDVSVFCSPN